MEHNTGQHDLDPSVLLGYFLVTMCFERHFVKIMRFKCITCLKADTATVLVKTKNKQPNINTCSKQCLQI